MVRINLLEVPEEERYKLQEGVPASSPRQPREGESPFEEVDLMFQPGGETAGGTAETKAEPTPSFLKPATEAEPAEPSVTKTKPSRPGVEPDAFEQTFSRNRLFLIVGIVLGVLLIAFSLYLILLPEEEPTAGRPVAEKATAGAGQTEAQATEGQSARNLQVQNLMAQNLAESQFYLSTLNKLLAVSTSETKLSLITMVPGYTYFVVVAPDRDALARLRIALKKQLPLLDFRVVSIESRTINGQPRIIADFSVTTPQKMQPASSVSGTTIEPATLPGAFRALGKKHQLNIRYFKPGFKSQHPLFQKIYFYSEMRGTPAQIKAFLSELTARYPALRIGKLSLYPANLAGRPRSTVTARLTLVLFVPKQIS